MAKMKYKSSLSYPNEGTNATPFNNNLKEFDEFIGESRKREKAWRKVALVLLLDTDRDITLLTAGPSG